MARGPVARLPCDGLGGCLHSGRLQRRDGQTRHDVGTFALGESLLGDALHQRASVRQVRFVGEDEQQIRPFRLHAAHERCLAAAGRPLKDAEHGARATAVGRRLVRLTGACGEYATLCLPTCEKPRFVPVVLVDESLGGGAIERHGEGGSRFSGDTPKLR